MSSFRNRSTLAALLATIVALAMISEVSAGPAQFGVKAGVSRAGQTWEYSNSWGTIERDSFSGFGFGVFAELPMTPLVALRVDALYVQKGNQVNVEERSYNHGLGTGRILTFKDRIDYFSLALTGKANVLRDPIGLFLIAGPRLDIKLSGSFDQQSLSIDSLYKSTVTGLVLGGGVEKSIGPAASVLLEFRYDLDLSDAGVSSNAETDLAIKNKSFLILAGLRF